MRTIDGYITISNGGVVNIICAHRKQHIDSVYPDMLDFHLERIRKRDIKRTGMVMIMTDDDDLIDIKPAKIGGKLIRVEGFESFSKKTLKNSERLNLRPYNNVERMVKK